MRVAHTPELVGKRYRLLNAVGQGGMGTVYKALDRLTGETVALKRVTVSGESLQFASRPSRGNSSDFRLALAQEFKTLASLRHPNIIGVLDYGFDAMAADGQQQPYFTMLLLEEAQTLTAFGRQQPIETRVELLVQTLQALAYLHRRGVLHRDLKPDNVQVVEGQVKVLDFGLAVARGQGHDQGDNAAGTLAYIAPEVLLGQEVTTASDLYAVGVMAYELFAGRHPFVIEKPTQLITDILSTPPVFSIPELNELDERLIAVIKTLLSKTPETRYHDAYMVVRDLWQALGRQTMGESAAIRESFLQAAEFVGRNEELQRLEDGLMQATDMHGSSWLVAGESGVGKSRLLDELRTRALVFGVPVLKGQGVAEGGMSYQLWREPLRRLILTTEMGHDEAGILKDIVPDIDMLLECTVSEALPLEGSAHRQRLLKTIVALFEKQTNPLLLVLEDLQWAEESVEVLRALNAVVGHLPLMIVGNYRIDERPELPNELPGMQVMRLERLDESSIARLSESMLGVGGRQPEIVHFLQRETEGNVFFLVEVVRTLAEEAGQLDRIGHMTLPSRVLAGGVQRIVQRRLSRLTEQERAPLQMAAVLGRQLDLRLIQAYSGKDDLEAELTACANAMILDVQENQWRFAHDKLREGLLADLSDEERRHSHRAAAELIVKVYGEDPAQAGALAYHWGMAGDSDKELIYAILAGDEAYRMNVHKTAAYHYHRALQLARQDEKTSHEQLTYLFTRLGRTYELDTRYQEAVVLYNEFEALAGQLNDTTMMLSATLNHAVVLSVPNAVVNLEEGSRLAQEALQLSRDLGDRAAEAKALWCLLLTGFYSGQMTKAIEYGEQSLAIARELNLREQLAYTLNNLALVYVNIHMPKALGYLEEVEGLWREQNNLSMLTDALGMAVFVYYLTGDFDRAVAASEESYRISTTIGNLWGQSFSLMLVGSVYAQRGQIDTALDIMERCLDLSVQAGHMAPLVETQLMIAETYAEMGAIDKALAATDEARHAAEMYMGSQVFTTEYFRAWFYFLNGDHESAETLLNQHLAAFNKDYAAAVLFASQIIFRLQVEFALLKGEIPHAQKLIQQAAAVFGESGVRIANAEILYYKGRVATASGRLDEARADLQRAAAEARALDMRLVLLKVLSLLAEIAEKEGNYQACTSYTQEIETLVLYICEHTSRPDVRGKFEALPFVKRILQDNSK